MTAAESASAPARVATARVATAGVTSAGVTSADVAIAGVAISTLAAAYAVFHHLGATSGSTREERARPLPGDDLIEHPTLVTNHAATLGAPPDEVWPWLTQVGWHRGGWYTPRWVDRLLFPDNLRSSEVLDDRWVRDLEVGDRVPDGPPGTAEFVVEVADAPRALVLHSRTHLPTQWRERRGASLDWVWTFALDPAPGGRTRMLIRNRGWVRPRWLDLAYRATIVPADHVMTRGMFRGLDQRVSA